MHVNLGSTLFTPVIHEIEEDGLQAVQSDQVSIRLETPALVWISEDKRDAIESMLSEWVKRPLAGQVFFT